MKSFLRLWGICFSFFVLVSNLHAQSPEDSRVFSRLDTSQIRLSMQFSSDYYYMGRADSSEAPYLSSSLGYYHKSGFFIRGGGSYLTAPGEGRMDLYIVSGGYLHQGTRYEAGASVVQYFFNEISYAVPAEMNTMVKAYGGYDFSLLMVYMDAGIGFSGQEDIFLGLEINRTFYAAGNALRFIPSLYVNLGTQQYYNEYYTLRSGRTGKGKGGNGQMPSGNMDVIVDEADKFELMDYEAELQIIYKLKKVRFNLSGTWTFPVNPSTIINDQLTYKEDLKNGFYWSAGFRLML